MTNDEKSILVSALKASPHVLLLGQRFLAARDEDNPVFAAIEGVVPQNFYSWWLGSELTQEARNQILHARGNAVALPELFESVRRLPWRCAFTSCIDPTPRRFLQVDAKRTVVERFLREENPDFTAIPLFRLFGSAGRPDSSDVPPLSAKSLSLRRVGAREMLSIISQVVTPRGRLFIEGWKPQHDWLRPRDLAPALVGFGDAQVLVFGLDSDEQTALRADEDFQALIDEGTVVLFQSTLAALVFELAEANEMEWGDARLLAPDMIDMEVIDRTPDRLQPPLSDRLRKVVLSQAEWRAINETISVLRDRNIAKPFVGTDLERYRAFREFLGRSPDLQMDTVSEFAFRRPQLDRVILPRVLEVLQSPSPQDQTILISGQSGVGKTTLLALLAIELRAAGIPVVFVRRGVVSPNLIQLDRFVQLVEGAGVRVPVVVIYDGLLEDYEYMKLARSMGSRGRKVLVVGSTYETQDKGTKRRTHTRRPVVHIVDLSVDLTPEERPLLLDHLSQFLPQDRALLERFADVGYGNFFATLYHLLDAARARLREGLVQEIEDAMESLAARLRETPLRTPAKTDIQNAMLQALRGTAFEQFLAPETMANALPDFKQKVDHLIDAVMVAGRFDVPVPQSIALRLLGNEHRAYQVAFHDCRILREREVTAGVYELTPRQPLEAEIWCQRRIPQKEDQFGLVREMAINIRSCEIGNDHSLETTFVVDLLRGFGPQGRLSDRVVQFYPRIAEVLDELRRQHTRVSPRLLLIKSHVTREWIGIKEQKLREDTRQRDLCAEDAAMIRNEWLPPVREAVTSVQQAIDMVCPPDCQDRLAQGARQLLATLFTELACTLGTEQACLHLLSRCSGETASSSISAIDVSLNDAMRAWQRALVYDEDSVQTHDAACWILRNRLEGPGLSAEREVELLVRWEEIIEQFRCLNLSDQQQDSLDGREAELQRARGDIDRFEAVLARMTERGSLAVHVLRSRFLVQDQGLDAARSYLEQNCGDSLLADRSVLLCYYRLWWQTETGEVGYFDHDSLVLPFSPHQWTRLAELAEARLQLDGEHDNCTALFHLGWALLQSGQSTRAKEVFDHLELVSLESYRRGRTLALVTEANGKPREFFGETRGRRLGNRGLAWVEDLRLEIPFSLYEWQDVAARPGRSLGPFHLALNYRGAFAQPPHKFTVRTA